MFWRYDEHVRRLFAALEHHEKRAGSEGERAAPAGQCGACALKPRIINADGTFGQNRRQNGGASYGPPLICDVGGSGGAVYNEATLSMDFPKLGKFGRFRKDVLKIPGVLKTSSGAYVEECNDIRAAKESNKAFQKYDFNGFYGGVCNHFYLDMDTTNIIGKVACSNFEPPT